MNELKISERDKIKVLFLMNGGLGDTCHAVPILFALKKKYPFIQFEHTFSSRYAESFFKLFFPDTDSIITSEIIGIKKKCAQLLKWRKKSFDYVVSGAHLYSSKTSIIACCISAKISIGIKDEKFSFLYDVRLPALDTKNYHERYASLFNYLGLDRTDIEYGEIVFSEELKKIAQNNIKIDLWQQRDSLQIAFVNGADTIVRGKWKPSLKRIPKPQLFDIFKKLKENIRTKFIILGTAKDPFPDEIIKDRNVLDIRGKTSLQDLISILRNIDLLICNDTAALHLAYYCGTHYIGIFGPTDSEQFAPERTRLNIIQANGNCSSCYPRPTCNLNYCMILSALDVDQILSRVRYIFEQNPSWARFYL